MIILGVTGSMGAGKGELIKLLINLYNFDYYSLSDVIRDEMRKLGIEITRENMQLFANNLRKERGSDVLAQIVSKKIVRNTVVDSIRNPSEVHYFKKNLKNFFLIGVMADQQKRFERIKQRNRENDPVTFDEFIQIDNKDLGVNEPDYGQGVSKCLQLADFKIWNNGTLEELKKSTINLLQRLNP